MSNIDLWRAILDNFKENKVKIFILVIASLLPFILKGGTVLFWQSHTVPFGKIADVVLDLTFGNNKNTWKDANGIWINVDKTKGILQWQDVLASLLILIAYIATWIYETAIIWLLIKSIRPSNLTIDDGSGSLNRGMPPQR